ncbi:metallophosphoesterase [Quadrisphaera sp. DSM 44207]|uniref:metallophosphoesterase family protein n=1 Tax=Quadrisphaera sp. DSM 44207 TaxID=1881057 RepID=UPI000883235E|nr:metallophosphoesterase [Quadrisphaera sp. DSM 44207]SDQ12344.1 UDP-2,3-diacylglucosamine pyrophosphatase LpxH [Quadrisphaera sp. DSM 44207]
MRLRLRSAPPSTWSRAAALLGRAGRSRVVRAALVVGVALAAAGSAMAALGATERSVGPVQVRLSVVPDLHGGTRVDVPPLGQLAMATHAGPLQLRARVEGIELDAATQLVSGGTTRAALVERVTGDVRAGLRDLALRSGAAALLGAGAACAVVFRRRAAVVTGVGAAAAVLAASGGIAAATLRTAALTEPTFTGLLGQAPALIGGVREIGTRFDQYSQQVTKLATNVTSLYGALSTLPTDVGGEGDVRVLWVSDVHDNPETFAVLPELVRQFDVAAVVDTGDVSDHGTAAENRLYDPIADLPVPYVYVRGNHDSRLTQEHLAAMPNVVVLDEGAVADVAGLRWAGTGDPQFTPDKRVRLDEDAVQELMTRAGQQVAAGAAAARAQGRPVDVALVHRRTMAGPLYGRVPLVLDGHTHRRSSHVQDGTLKLTQGSSGGAGLRTLEGGRPHPLQMSVLHFDGQERRLLAVDDITIGGLGERSVTVERHAADSYLAGEVPEAEAPAEEAPAEEAPAEEVPAEEATASPAASPAPSTAPSPAP